MWGIFEAFISFISSLNYFFTEMLMVTGCEQTRNLTRELVPLGILSSSSLWFRSKVLDSK